MNIDYKALDGNIGVSYGGDTLLLDAIYNSKVLMPSKIKVVPGTNQHELEDNFKGLNAYLRSLSAKESAELYGVINTFYSNVYSGSILSCEEATRDVVYGETIGKILNHDKVYAWVDKNLPVPPDISKEWVKETVAFTREKTYTVRDYKELLCLIIVAKLLSPIIGVYIKTYKKVAISSIHDAIELLPEFISNYPGYQKLKTYAESAEGKTPLDPMGEFTMANNMSSENKLGLLIGQVFLIKLPTYPLYNDSEGNHIVTWFSSTLTGKPGIASVKAKTARVSADGDSSISVLESNMAKQKYTIEEYELLKLTASPSYFCSVMGISEPKLNRLVKDSVENKIGVDVYQLELIKLALANEVHEMAYSLIDHLNIKQLQAAAYLKLEALGHTLIANAIVAMPLISTDGELVRSTSNVRTRLATDKINDIKAKYPDIKTGTNRIVTMLEDTANRITMNVPISVLTGEELPVYTEIRDRLYDFYMAIYNDQMKIEV